MAHSFIEYQDRYAPMRDANIALVVALVADFEKRRSPQAPAAFASEWLRKLRESAPGAIDLEMDHHFPGSEGQGRLVALLESAKAELRAEKTEVDAAAIREIIGPSWRFEFGDQDREDLANQLDKVLDVVAAPAKVAR